ncbi:unnamed protein product [Arabidopsis thaliana]|uniref:F-box domain-containing protein n=1 Tax=Arabidopsis thaliana TaxID=3702 RepID=A0A5S9X3K7_ARATH|nr:unnamed protein product [Arabidopsis thaliana]
MEKMSDLPRELVEEILSRVPVKSMREVRVTCKTWNALSKHISKAEAAREGEFLGIAKVWNRNQDQLASWQVVTQPATVYSDERKQRQNQP